MLTLTLDPQDASAHYVKRRFALHDEELDPEFGVVEVDREKGRYAVLVDEQAAARVQGTPGVEGPFANPPIEPFGPPQP
jgi:hypothetical protein